MGTLVFSGCLVIVMSTAAGMVERIQYSTQVQIWKINNYSEYSMESSEQAEHYSCQHNVDHQSLDLDFSPLRSAILNYFQASLLIHIPTVSFALLEVAFPPLLLIAMH